MINRAPHHKLTPELKARIVGLFERGLSRTDIQIETEVSQPTIRKILEEAGYPSKAIGNRTEITDDIRKEAVALYNQLHSSLKVAAQLGIAKRTVLNILSEEVKGIKPRSRGEVSPEAFIKTWQESDHPAEVALALGMTVQKVCGKASQYRQRGVPLKKYNRGQINWDELKEFAELFTEEGEDFDDE